MLKDSDLGGLPAHVIDHRLLDEELARLFPHGYKELLDEIYRPLHIIPETFIVDLFRNSIATPLLVASIIKSTKFR